MSVVERLQRRSEAPSVSDKVAEDLRWTKKKSFDATGLSATEIHNKLKEGSTAVVGLPEWGVDRVVTIEFPRVTANTQESREKVDKAATKIYRNAVENALSAGQINPEEYKKNLLFLFTPSPGVKMHPEPGTASRPMGRPESVAKREQERWEENMESRIRGQLAIYSEPAAVVQKESRQSRVKRGIVMIGGAAMVLASCAPVVESTALPATSITPESEPQPPTVTQPVIPTESPTVTSTPTESVTPTPEVTNYGICEIESFKECQIPPEDLFNGEYLAFLETLSTPFDSNTMKQVPWINSGKYLLPDSSTAPNFEGMTTIGAESGADFRRGITSGFVEFEGLNYLILPVEFYDQENPDKNVWVITVYPLFFEGENYAEGTYEENLFNWWRNLMKVTPFYVTRDNPDGALKAPLTYQTFDQDPTMEQRLSSFVAGKRSSLHGKVLMTTISANDNNKPVRSFN